MAANNCRPYFYNFQVLKNIFLKKYIDKILYICYCIYIKFNLKYFIGVLKMQNESKRERFIRIAEARTNKILSMMRLLGNCSSVSNYDYTDDDIKKIFGALDKELKTTKNKFLGIEGQEEKFSLR